jgi:isochorismate synthase
MIKQGIEKTFETSQLIALCTANHYPFAIYRYPNLDKIWFLVCTNKTAIQKNIDFEDQNVGFVMAPYDASKQLPYFFSADILLEINGTDQIKLDDEQILKLEISNINVTDSTFTIVESDFDFLKEKEDYIKKVLEVKQSIKSGECTKVVLSRKRFLGRLKTFNYFKGFRNLEKANPSAFVSLVYMPWQEQIWMGATPETLIHQNKNGIFKTVALAGTQTAIDPNGNEISTIDALWSQKEIEEQALVSRYIINCLKKIRVREYLEEGPKTINAGNLLHLNSTYSINTKEINFQNLSTVMLELLHPTPAVCGMPKVPATNIINQIENYNREFYSGYLGPINIEDNSHLFVNLRTMKIENSEVFAYAGGGLTEDSNPEKEWLETELKLKTITKAFC